jgi:hypothetical protein
MVISNEVETDLISVAIDLIHRIALSGLVIRVPGYKSRGPGSIPSATTFSEK